jgi:hypothetical protein
MPTTAIAIATFAGTFLAFFLRLLPLFLSGGRAAEEMGARAPYG